MGRNTNPPRGGGRRHRNARAAGAAPQQRDGHAAAAAWEPDDWHNSDSPSCRRLAVIANHELALGSPDGAGDDGTTPSGFAALVHDYVVWGRAADASSATGSTAATATAASKKKKKKKKKKKSGTATTTAPTATTETKGGVATAVSQDDDEDEGAPPPPPPSSETSSVQTTATAASNGVAAAAPSPVAVTPHQRPATSSWEGLRLQRRRSWVDRFVEYHRQELATTRGVTQPPRPVESVQGDVDRFLAWLSSSSNPKPVEALSQAQPRTIESSSSSSAPLVPFSPARVQQAAEGITCFDCQHRVMRHLETPLVLSGSQEVDDDHPTTSFQYQAMEEGDGRALPPHTLTLFPPTSEQPTWRLERADGSPIVWTREVLDFWLQEYILLGGLGYDRVVVTPTGMTELTREQTLEIHGNLSRIGAELAEDSNQISKLLEKQVAEYQRLGADNAPANMKSPGILWDIDTELSAILSRIMRLILRITNSYQRVALYQTRVARQTDRDIPIMSSRLMADEKAIIHLWDIFLMQLQNVFQLIAEFEKKYVSQVDGQGQIPHLFFNRDARQWFKDYVSQKVMAIHHMLDVVMNAADGQDDGIETCTTLFRLSLGRSVAAMDDFLRVTVPEHDKVSSKDELDDACEDVLYILNEWSEHLRQNALDKFIEEHEHRRDRLAEAFDRTDQVMQMRMNQLSADNPDTKSIKLMYQAWSRRDLSGITIKDMSDLRKSREMILTKTGAMIQLWIKFGRNRDVDSTYPSQYVTMDLNLLQWTATGRHKDPQKGVCVYGEKSRAGGIVSSLIFDWMSTRYSEWQAELAGQELLVDLTIDTGANTWSHVARGSKKNAKKKATTASAPKAAPAPTPVPPEPASGEAAKKEDAPNGENEISSRKAVTKKPTSEEDKNGDTTMGSSVSGETAVDGSKADKLVESHPGTPLAAEDKCDPKKQDEPDDARAPGVKEWAGPPLQTSGHDANTPESFVGDQDDSSPFGGIVLSADEIDANIGMEVVDRSGSSQSAHDFLLSRFLKVINMSKGKEGKVVKIL